MKKILFLALVALFVSGVAFSDSIPGVTDPQRVPIVWTQSVYNGSGSDIVTAIIVEWDFDTSNPSGTFYDDRTNYVQTADSAGDIWTAGVTPYDLPIANGDQGIIIVRGPALVKNGTNTVTADDICETDANGYVSAHDGAAVDEGTIGVAIKDAPTGFTDISIIWINPVQYDKD